MMTKLVIALTLRRPALLDEINSLAQTAWLALAWTLRELLSTEPLPAMLSPHRDRMEHQVELLGTFLMASGDDPSQLSSESLCNQFRLALCGLEGRLKPNEVRVLAGYREALGYLAEYVTTGVATTALLHQADVCLDSFLHLETERSNRYQAFRNEARSWFLSLPLVPTAREEETDGLIYQSLGKIPMAASR